MIRPSRLIAIARRDLKMELKGRRGLGLPLVMIGLMLPVSAAPRLSLPGPQGPPAIAARGDVPPEVLAIDGVTLSDEGGLGFEQTPGRLEVRGGPLTDAIRGALDARDPAPVAVEWLPRPIPVPGRSLLFALLSASTLTGAVSASIGGERSARTLIALLAAAVSRTEVVLGKWLAWAGLGALTSSCAAAIAIGLGRVDAGWWVLPMVSVPLCAVALSLWLVRRASDVIGGTTVTLRVVPAMVGAGGLLAWFVGLDRPLLGAAVPLGGALMAAGSTWGPSPVPALIATASTGLMTFAFLRGTWNDLEETIRAPRPPSRPALALRTAALGALVWWPPLLGPLLWAAAGNEVLTASLPTAPGVWAAALGLALVTWVHTSRATAPGPSPWSRPAPIDLGLAAIAGVGLGLLLSGPITPLPEHLAEAQLRMSAALNPPSLLAGVAAALATEALFRGWLTRESTERWALAAWILVCAPLDPLGGLVSGVVLAAVARRGGMTAAVVARLVQVAVVSLA